MTKFIKVLTLASLFLALHGCLYPESPGIGVIVKTTPLIHVKGEWLEMAPHRREIGPKGKSRISLARKCTKNLLFIAADHELGKKLKSELTKMYQRDVRLEDALWWHYAPTIKKTYNRVLRIHWDGFNAQSLDDALSEMEILKQPYDVMLLAHGLPNHLLASEGQGVVTFEQLAAFKGLQFADTLYLQACFGNTLAADFLDLGFLRVIASEGFSINLFYPDYYLEALSTHAGNSQKAFDSVNEHFTRRFEMNPIQRQIVKRVFADDSFIQGDPSKYLQYLTLPEIYQR